MAAELHELNTENDTLQSEIRDLQERNRNQENTIHVLKKERGKRNKFGKDTVHEKDLCNYYTGILYVRFIAIFFIFMPGRQLCEVQEE